MEKRPLPRIATQAEWQAARDQLLLREKALTKLSDSIAAERRLLPMVKIEKDYLFDGDRGKVRLVDLFEGRSQMILYHIMYDPKWESACNGCSMLADGLGNPAHLNARDISLVLVSLAPLSKLQQFRERMGWTVPWYSSFGSDFNADFGRTKDGEELSGTSVFLRDGNDVYRTYFCSDRGDEVYMPTWKLMDLVPYGRQETWEKSPQGWPQSPPYDWWRLHDEY